MSLRAKLEAVIYAAEEPVTLAQLAGLFAVEAMEWKGEQEAAAAEAEAAEKPTPLLMIDEGLQYLGLEQTPEFYSAGSAPVEQPEGSAPAPEPVNEADAAAQELGLGDAVAEPVTGEASDSEAEAKRLARQRDREVKAILRQLLDELIASCAADERGVEIREIAGGYRMATKPEYHDAVRLFIKSLKPAMKLSLPALETLAVIAYKQPVTAPEVNEIRGVESAGVLGSLLSRKLITTAGRKQVIGRPILYKTTKEFLLRFGLKDVAELPSMDEFEKMAAIELTDADAEGEDVGGPGPGGGPDLDENAPEDETGEEASTAEALASAGTGTPEEPAATGATDAPAETFANTEHAEVETAPHD
ncbi:MAG TPA: SMC-Scp complex subunit ScpB [Terracidiphilus sp.]|jgi:segregation and condensation protein B|nr:SMC-Scp complex subunit ScpB [Terracidiphilus sp.]